MITIAVMMKNFLLLIFILVTIFSFDSIAFQTSFGKRSSSKMDNLKMIELEANSATYAAMFVVTIIPSLAFGNMNSMFYILFFTPSLLTC